MVSSTVSSQATDWREGRWLRGWELHKAGWNQLEPSGGRRCPWGHVRGGLPVSCRLSAAQQARVLAWLAEAHGFRGELWTRRRVAALIERKLGVRHHPGHVSKLLASWGWSVQKPERRARQRDEAAIRQWRTERWPAIKKSGPH